MSGSLDTSCASQGRAVTPTDNTSIPECRALWIGGAGNIVVKFADVQDVTVSGNTVTLVGVPAGTLLPIRVKCVNSTSTTATSIVALY